MKWDMNLPGSAGDDNRTQRAVGAGAAAVI